MCREATDVHALGQRIVSNTSNRDDVGIHRPRQPPDSLNYLQVPSEAFSPGHTAECRHHSDLSIMILDVQMYLFGAPVYIAGWSVAPRRPVFAI